jgi:hypothetical protein
VVGGLFRWCSSPAKHLFFPSSPAASDWKRTTGVGSILLPLFLTTVALGLLASPATIPAVEPTQHLGLKVHAPSLRLFGATIKSPLALILDFGSRTVQTGVLF